MISDKAVEAAVKAIDAVWVDLCKEYLSANLLTILARAALEAASAAEWMPIETAPKDGTSVLLATPGTVYEGYHDADADGWWADGQIYPVAWRPLPSPPKDAPHG